MCVAGIVAALLGSARTASPSDPARFAAGLLDGNSGRFWRADIRHDDERRSRLSWCHHGAALDGRLRAVGSRRLGCWRCARRRRRHGFVVRLAGRIRGHGRWRPARTVGALVVAQSVCELVETCCRACFLSSRSSTDSRDRASRCCRSPATGCTGSRTMRHRWRRRRRVRRSTRHCASSPCGRCGRRRCD